MHHEDRGARLAVRARHTAGAETALGSIAESAYVPLGALRRGRDPLCYLGAPGRTRTSAHGLGIAPGSSGPLRSVPVRP
jgi:hypothetical protein